MERDGIIFYSSFLDGIGNIQDESERLKAYEYILYYGIKGIEPTPDGSIAYSLFLMAKPQIDANNKRYVDGCKGGRKPKEKTMVPEKNNHTSQEKKPKDKVKDKVKVKDKEKDNTNILTSKDVKTEIKISDKPKKDEYGNELINQLIILIKDKCNELGIAYDKQKERQYGKLILTGKDFGEFCEKIGQTREEFAINILIASAKIGFWKGICSGPMKIYLNYAEVYNETVKQHSKNQKNLIQSF